MEVRRGNFKNPFPERPWISGTGAAMAPSQKNQETKWGKSIVSGGITGGIEICITYPTEYAKTQLQLDGKGSTKQYSGFIDCVKKTVQTKGISGLYRGLSVLIYGSVPKSAIRFGTNEFLKSYAVDEKGTLSPTSKFFCGMGAGVGEALFAVIPMETVKVKFINDQRSANPRFRGFLHGVSIIVKEQGVRGIYKGVSATVLKQGSNQAIRFTVVGTLQDYYRDVMLEGDQSKTIPVLWTGLFGGIAGTASVFANTPVDVVKTRMQGLDAHKYKSTWDCAVQIKRNEGYRAFYKGTIPRMSRVTLDVAITFVIYDLVNRYLLDPIWPK